MPVVFSNRGIVTAPAASGGGGGGGGVDNPDSIPDATTTYISKDYEANNGGTDAVTFTGQQTDFDGVINEWDAGYGWNGTGGWRFRPDPSVVKDPSINEDSAGLNQSGANPITVDSTELLVISYMLKITQELLDEIAYTDATAGGGTNPEFWAHDLKCIDFKYWDAAGTGEGNRNTIQFGGDGTGNVRFCHVEGGGGTRYYFGPDWDVSYGDVWAQLWHVIDMRGATPGARYIATYMKATGDTDVVRIGQTFEDASPVNLEAYENRGIRGLFSPVWGYWDDMTSRNEIIGTLANMAVYVDRLRVANGWIAAAF
jgi:hypothetical protein